MRILLLFIACATALCSKAQDYNQHITSYRDSINRVMADPTTSILSKELLNGFQGLKFYAPDEEWVVNAQFQRIKDGKVFKMKTTTTREPAYRPYGKLTFEKNGQSFNLTVYENVAFARNPKYDRSLFLPFTDLSNGDGSYGGGRYIDVNKADLDDLVIDFNKSYNPYCCYNDKYSCPIPPAENHLNIRVEAGVKPLKH